MQSTGAECWHRGGRMKKEGGGGDNDVCCGGREETFTIEVMLVLYERDVDRYAL